MHTQFLTDMPIHRYRIVSNQYGITGDNQSWLPREKTARGFNAFHFRFRAFKDGRNRKLGRIMHENANLSFVEDAGLDRPGSSGSSRLPSHRLEIVIYCCTSI
jgi:hypothetical protein